MSFLQVGASVNDKLPLNLVVGDHCPTGVSEQPSESSKYIHDPFEIFEASLTLLFSLERIQIDQYAASIKKILSCDHG